MNKNILKSFVLAVTLSIGLGFNFKMNSFLVCAENDARLKYYDVNGVNSEYLKSVKGVYGMELQNSLSILMSATQNKITTYEELKTQTIKTDTDPMNSNNIITFYARESISGTWNQSLWSREHVWCQSLSNGLYGTSGAGSDIHHLRPAYNAYNSKRNNSPYGIVDKSIATELGNTGNYYIGTTVFEPRDDIKGDIARILMYVYTRYSNSLTAVPNELGTRGNLKITDIVKTSSNSETDAWNLLLEWNELDPVNYLEIYRNDEAEKIQGNRNVFIDHPEFANMCFGEYEGKGALIDLNGVYDDTKANYIGINFSNVSLSAGKEETFIAKTFPENVKTPTIKWKSNDNDVITINSSGKAVAINDGRTTIEAYTSTGLSAKCNVEVYNSKLIYAYDGTYPSGLSSYAANVNYTYTNNDIEMELMASYGIAQNGDMWIGSNNNSTHIKNTVITKDSPIGKALSLTTNRTGAVLYFNTELDNVGKVTFQQIVGNEKEAAAKNTYLSLAYSIDNGKSYTQIDKSVHIGNAAISVTYDFDAIESARYALVFTTTNGYVQSRKPQVTFFSEEVTGDELIEDLLNNFDATDLNNSVYQSILITKAYKIFNTLDESDKNKIPADSINKLMSLSDDDIQGYEFIYYHWSKTNNTMTEDEIDEIIAAFDSLSDDAKAFVSNMKNDIIENEDIITIGDAINYFKADKNPWGDEEKDPNKDPEVDPKPGSDKVPEEDPKVEPENDDNPNNIMPVAMGAGAGVVIIIVALVFILRKKH
ncbi:MAG: endonuclease [Erysipelotrichales bacterium]|nr:endonuclease [Erysipelotrichales bacterium]